MLPRASIRFYEIEGLLRPARKSNGYRYYSEEDALTLEKIAFLRRLELPLDTIRRVQSGEIPLSLAARQQWETLRARQTETAHAAEICGQLYQDGSSYTTLQPERYAMQLPPAARQAIPAEKPGYNPAAGHYWRRYFARTLDHGTCGLIWGLLSMLGMALLPRALAAALLTALPWLLTGFIHLDGYMDTSDAMLSWRPLEDRLRILKDSHTGSFAVVSLVLLALFSFAAASSLDAADLRALLLIPVVSRCGSAFCVIALKPLGHSEYAAMKDSRGQQIAVIALFLAALAAGWLWLGWRCAVVLAVEALAYAASMAWTYRTLKGVSGDLAGFSLTVAEAAALIALCVAH